MARWLALLRATTESPRKAASISGATGSARRVGLADLQPVDLVVMGSVAAAEDGARLGKGGGFADLEFALATMAGLIGPDTVCVTTVHELQVRPAGTIPLTDHDVPVDLIITPDRVIDCRPGRGPRQSALMLWQSRPGQYQNSPGQHPHQPSSPGLTAAPPSPGRPARAGTGRFGRYE
jgi:5-formyltetrahydrofolate cyclo-ligase family